MPPLPPRLRGLLTGLALALPLPLWAYLLGRLAWDLCHA